MEALAEIVLKQEEQIVQLEGELELYKTVFGHLGWSSHFGEDPSMYVASPSSKRALGSRGEEGELPGLGLMAAEDSDGAPRDLPSGLGSRPTSPSPPLSPEQPSTAPSAHVPILVRARSSLCAALHVSP